MSIIGDDIESTQRNPEGPTQNGLLQRLDDVTNDSLDNFVCQEENNLDITRKEQEIQEIETEIVEVQSRLEELHCRKRKCVIVGLIYSNHCFKILKHKRGTFEVQEFYLVNFSAVMNCLVCYIRKNGRGAPDLLVKKKKAILLNHDGEYENILIKAKHQTAASSLSAHFQLPKKIAELIGQLHVLAFSNAINFTQS